MKSKEKHPGRIIFGDLKPGDTIWRMDTVEWCLIPIKVVKIVGSLNIGCIRIYLENGSNLLVYTRDTHYNPMKLWADIEEAKIEMLKESKELEPIYIKTIDDYISRYDALIKWRKSLKI